MAVEPIQVVLTDGQKLEALKRYHQRYSEELEQLDAEVTELRTRLAEYEFLVKFLGEQPEVVELRDQAERVEKLEARRQHVSKLLERLERHLPKDRVSNEAVTFKRF